jgi:hypothetical protein
MNSLSDSKSLDIAHIQLEYAAADFRHSARTISESLKFVGLEAQLLNLIEASRAVQLAVNARLAAERKVGSLSSVGLGRLSTPLDAVGQVAIDSADVIPEAAMLRHDQSPYTRSARGKSRVASAQQRRST